MQSMVHPHEVLIYTSKIMLYLTNEFFLQDNVLSPADSVPHALLALTDLVGGTSVSLALPCLLLRLPLPLPSV